MTFCVCVISFTQQNNSETLSVLLGLSVVAVFIAE